MLLPNNGELTNRPALEGLVRPPAALLARLQHYRRRYGFWHAALSFIGRHSFALWQVMGPAVTRPYLKRWINSNAFKILNLGGGSVLSDRWLTADITPRADVYMDVTKPLPLPDGCVDVVFSEEVLEHMSRAQGGAMLRECLRVLKLGGWLRLATPSLDYFAKRALANPAETTEVNQIFYGHGHRHIYSEAEMRVVLTTTGFSQVRQSRYREPESHFGYLDTHPERVRYAPPEWSQYWEAQKPSQPLAGS